MRFALLVPGLGLLALAPLVLQGQTEDAPLAIKARMVLEKHCFECHGQDPKKVKKGVNLVDPARLLDRDQKIVVPRKPEESLLWQQIERGKMPKDGLPLSAGDRLVLRQWIVEGASVRDWPTARTPAPVVKTPASQKKEPAGEAGLELAGQVKELFRQRCLECHGGSKPRGDLRILDHAQLVQEKQVLPGKPEESPVYQSIVPGEGVAKPIMPRGQPALSKDEQDLVRRWILTGAPVFPEDVQKPDEPDREVAWQEVSGVDYVLKQIQGHIRKPGEQGKLPFLRYFSLNHLLMTGVTAAELERHREALAKAINHLSWEGGLVHPRAVDPPVNSIYAVDIRDLGWQQKPYQRIRNGKEVGPADLNLFDLVLLEYPYGFAHEGSQTYSQLLREYVNVARMVRPIPYVRADWFVSVATQPPLYEELLQLPLTVQELEQKLVAGRAEANLAEGRAIRGGLALSDVSHNNRVVERHPLTGGQGGYWKSYDFRGSKGAANIFKNPIDLRPAGGEMIFNLPNGLQGYYIADGAGNRLEAAPTEIVTDSNAADQTVRNGLSCMRCHDKGMKFFTDAVRPALQRLQGRPGFDKDRALDLYPDQKVLTGWLKKDSERFQKALAEVLGKPQGPEPLLGVSRRYLDAPLSLRTVTGELGLSEPAGLDVLFRAPQFTALGLVPLTAEGVIRRDAWEDYFDLVVSGMGLAMPIPAVDGVIRRDFPAGATPVNVELKTNKPNNLFTPEDELRIEVVNKGKVTAFIELIGTSSKGYKEILVTGEKVEPGQTYCFPAPSKGPRKAKNASLGKEQITLYASDKEFPAGEVHRGKGVSDRVVHEFWKIESRNDGRTRVVQNPKQLIKRTIEIETR